jgi:hypothetical protein
MVKPGKRNMGQRGGGRVARTLGAKETLPRILIVCEGKKTEPLYFDALRRNMDYPMERFGIVGGNISGTDPKCVVEYAKKRRNEINREVGRDANLMVANENVFCIFDRDEHERLTDALQQARDNNFTIGYSNPSFELWYLLHYSDQTAHIERDDVIRKLKNHVKDYDKTEEGIFELIKDNEPDAVGRAESLRRMHNKNGTDEIKANPRTTVDEVIAKIRNLKKNTE